MGNGLDNLVQKESAHQIHFNVRKY